MGGECQRGRTAFHARAGARSHARGVHRLGRGVSVGGGGGTWVLGYLAAEPVRTLAGTLPPRHGARRRRKVGIWDEVAVGAQRQQVPGQSVRIPGQDAQGLPHSELPEGARRGIKAWWAGSERCRRFPGKISARASYTMLFQKKHYLGPAQRECSRYRNSKVNIG